MTRCCGVIALASFHIACGGPSGPLNMKLNYTPTSRLELGSMPAEVLAEPISIRVVGDQRTRDPASIGENLEDDAPIKVLTDPKSVPQLVQQALSIELQKAGLKIHEGAPIQLAVEILDLWIQEEHTYKGSVRLKIDVMRGGTSQGSVVVDGSSSRWGSSLSAENYNEVLSDCLVNVVQNLLRAPEFHAAFAAHE